MQAPLLSGASCRALEQLLLGSELLLGLSRAKSCRNFSHIALQLSDLDHIAFANGIEQKALRCTIELKQAGREISVSIDPHLQSGQSRNTTGQRAAANRSICTPLNNLKHAQVLDQIFQTDQHQIIAPTCYEASIEMAFTVSLVWFRAG